MRLIIDNVKYKLWVPSLEDKFERMVSEHSHDIFGNDSIWFNSKQKIKSQAGVGSIPDALVISFSGRPQWYVVEIELASHSVYGHIVPQINKFINGIKNSSTRHNIINAIYNDIKNDVVKAARLRKTIGSDELHHFIANLIFKDPILVIIIDKITEELKEVKFPIGETKLVEFMTFEREGVGLEVHAHLFEPIISEKAIEPKENKTKPPDRFIELEIRKSWMTEYGYGFYIPKKYRGDFPGFKAPFILETAIGEITTYISCAPKGTLTGDPQAGHWVGNLKKWYEKHPEIKVGDKLIFEIIEPLKRYRLITK